MTKKVGRNDPCPCGSGLKYKKCCLNTQLTLTWAEADASRIRLKSASDVGHIREAGRLVVDTLRHVQAAICPGIRTDDINTLVHEFTIRNGAVPAPLGYKGFPKSTCVSVNEEVLHGVPGTRMLSDGDIVNVDVTSILNGYYADANMMFFVGQPSANAQRIVNITRECLRIGISMVKPRNTVGDIGWAIQRYAEGEGCSVVREWAGHGVGFAFHEAPSISHFGQKGEGVKLAPGMVFTIEPMINLGGREIRVLEDGWTVVTSDGSLSAQFEQTVLVTRDGVESLTPYELI
jgi:methionyl aminopeptidase